MKKTILALIAALTLTQTAKADVIVCNFTEPFVRVTYSMTQQTLTIEDPVVQKLDVIRNVSFQIKSAGKFVLVGANKKVVMTLELNGKGSDGMSDQVYPYDVKWDARVSKFQQYLYGGCTSNQLHSSQEEN